LIGQHLAHGAQITLVNRSPAEPESVLKQIGRSAHHILSSFDCIKTDLIADYEEAVGTALAPSFVTKLDGIDDIPVMGYIADAGSSMHVVTDITEETGRLVLVASESKFEWSDEASAIRAPRLRDDIARALKSGSRVLVRCRGVDHPVLAVAIQDQPVRWLRVEG
jgi:hypothetical protein